MGETNKSILSLNNVFDLKKKDTFHFKRLEEVISFRYINVVAGWVVKKNL